VQVIQLALVFGSNPKLLRKQARLVVTLTLKKHQHEQYLQPTPIKESMQQ
jgi:hypothetical protein